jgi:hypothetical protein
MGHFLNVINFTKYSLYDLGVYYSGKCNGAGVRPTFFIENSLINSDAVKRGIV